MTVIDQIRTDGSVVMYFPFYYQTTLFRLKIAILIHSVVGNEVCLANIKNQLLDFYACRKFKPGYKYKERNTDCYWIRQSDNIIIGYSSIFFNITMKAIPIIILMVVYIESVLGDCPDDDRNTTVNAPPGNIITIIIIIIIIVSI